MIEYKNGIHLKGTELWFDSKKKTELSFISSADIDKFTSPEKIIATPETIKLLEKKLRKPVLLSCPYNRPFTLGNLQVELIPSGHMLGSAQMIVDKGDKTLIYAGDINLEKLPTSEPVSMKKCDVLVLKCSYGADQDYPEMEKSLDRLTKFIEETFDKEETPVITVKPIGVCQDIIKTLGDRGYKISLERSIYNVTKIYEDLGVKFGDIEILKNTEINDRVIFIPIEQINSDKINDIKSKRIALINEYDEDNYSDVKTDETFTFSSKASNKQLLKYVERIKPKKVYLIGKYANDFSKTIESKGYETIVLEKPTQLDLL